MHKPLKIWIYLLLLIFAGNNLLFSHEFQPGDEGDFFFFLLSENWRWIRYGIDAGLPAEKVTAIAETPGGQL